MPNQVGVRYPNTITNYYRPIGVSGGVGGLVKLGWDNRKTIAHFGKRAYKVLKNNNVRPRGPFGSKLKYEVKDEPMPQAQASTSAARRSSRGSGRKPGMYAGKFNKATKASKSTPFDTFSKKGAAFNLEVSGTCTDTDCVYIGQAAFIPDQMYSIVWQALIRKLFQKALKLDIQSMDNVPPSWETFSVDILVVDVVTGGELTVLSQAFANSSTSYRAFADTVGQAVSNYVSGDAATDFNRRFSRIKLFRLADSTNTSGTPINNVISEINLLRTKVHTISQVELNIQNFTTASSSTDDTIEEVDNCPLKGRQYIFKGFAPQYGNVYQSTQVGGAKSFCPTMEEGTILKRGKADTTSTVAFWEPPLPKAFNNCTKSSYVTLDPGQSKVKTFTYRSHKYFNQFLWSTAYTTAANVTVRCREGPTVMFALEKRIHIGNQSVICAYESNIKMGCYVTAPTDTFIDMRSLNLTYTV
nr:MAG: capsid protein [Owegonang virus 16]